MKRIIITTCIVALCIFGFRYLTDYELVLGNKGPLLYRLEIATQVLITFLIALFFWHTLNPEAQKKKSSGVIGSLGSVFGFLVVGCPLCGFSLAGAVGMTGILIALPFNGEEFKVIAIILLIAANVLVRRKPQSCKIPTKA